MSHRIVQVEPNSIAEELGVRAGDRLIALAGRPVADCLDYQYLLNTEYIEAEFETEQGERWIAEIDKDVDEDLGLVFETGLMSAKRACANHCVFCFIDQLPAQTRASMQFKDDDWRLSFLQGNYVTLTNVSDRELQRIVDQRIEPLYISVHATDPQVRLKMMRNPRADRIAHQLRILADGGIHFYIQIVLCPGLNDGDVLEDTIQTLSQYRPYALHTAIVPVGLSEHRQGLYPLTSFTQQTAAAMIERVERLMEGQKEPFVQLADEFYLLAEKPMPPAHAYGSFSLVEDGIGMVRLLEKQFMEALAKTRPCGRRYTATIATGTLVYPFMRTLMDRAQTHLGIEIQVYPVANTFFGGKVNVTGLLSGQCLIRGLRDKPLGDKLFLTRAMFRAQEDVLLDDMTLEQLRQTLQVPIEAVENDGAALVQALAKGKE